MASWNFGGTIGDRLGRIQTDTSGLDEARRVGSGIRRSIGDVLGAYRSGKEMEAKSAEKEKTEQNRIKIQQLVQDYNNPNSPEYEGMSPYQKALKLARLLYPLDQSMSQRYEDEARNLKQTEAKYAQEQSITEQKIGQKAEELAVKKQAQKEAETEFNQAVTLWRNDPENQVLKDNVNLAHGKAQTAGLKLINPVEQRIRQQAVEFSQGLQTATLDLNKSKAEWDKLQDEQKSQIEKQKLGLQIADFARKAKESESKLSGSTLPAETVAKVSNLQTVLESLDTIENEINNVKSGSSSIGGLRNAKYAIDLAVENLGRVQSGGAISAEEVKNFKNLISPSLLDFTDSGATYLRNVNSLRQSINNKISNLSSEGRNITSQAVPQSGQPTKPQATTGFKLRKR